MLALYIGLFSYPLQDRQRIDKQPSMRRQQALQQGGGVTVVSRGEEGGVRARVVLIVSKGLAGAHRCGRHPEALRSRGMGSARSGAGRIAETAAAAIGAGGERGHGAARRRVAAGAGCRTGGSAARGREGMISRVDLASGAVLLVPRQCCFSALLPDARIWGK
jgi:hypothetical protein